jgi:hypothetical protein
LRGLNDLSGHADQAVRGGTLAYETLQGIGAPQVRIQADRALKPSSYRYVFCQHQAARRFLFSAR